MDSDHGLWHTFKSPGGGDDWFDRHKKAIVKYVVHFQFQLNTLGVFKCPHRQNIRDWGQHVEPYREKCLRTYIDTNFSPCFGVREHTFESFRSILATYCIKGNVTDMSRLKGLTTQSETERRRGRDQSAATLGPENEGSFCDEEDGKRFTRISANCLKDKTDAQF